MSAEKLVRAIEVCVVRLTMERSVCPRKLLNIREPSKKCSYVVVQMLAKSEERKKWQETQRDEYLRWVSNDPHFECAFCLVAKLLFTASCDRATVL